MEELFSKRIPITLKSSDREDRKNDIQVTVEMHTNITPVHRKELVIRLTDGKDLFFLYTLRLNEEDFQSLKIQQGLLVDFAAFPQKFIDLLQMVLQEEHKEVPKFILEFVCSGGSLGTSTGILNVIETNPFKHLTHLALKYLPGTDTDVKKYLADCLKTLKDNNAMLVERFQHTEADLSQQLRQAREALSARTLELDSLKSEWSSRSAEMLNKHAQELNAQKELSLQTQSSAQQRFEREKREVEQAHLKLVKQLEAKLYEVEASNKDLLDRKYKSEGSIREQKTKLSTLEEEYHRAKQELASLRKNNAGLDSDYHEQEKMINQLKTRLAVCEQEIKDKEEVLSKTSALLLTEQDHKHKLDEDLNRRQRQISKLELSVKKLTEELIKGNEIIKKLQGENKNYHTKLKLRNQVTTEQEKLLGEKNKEMEEIRKDLESAKTGLHNKEDEVKKLNESLEATMQKLEESRQLLKTNQNVIDWLNKQVTEAQLHQHTKHASGPFEMNPSGTTTGYRPAMHNYSAPGSHISGRASTVGSLHSTPASVVSAPPHIRQPQIHYNQNIARRPIAPQPLAKSSPLSVMSIPEEKANLNKHPHTEEGGFLDAKYLQSSGDATSGRGVAGGRTSPIPIHFASHTTPPAASTHNPTRISKDVISSKAAPQSKSSQPSLASVYFPGTKVS